MDSNEMIERVINRIVNASGTESWGMDMNHFDWVPGVGLYGLYKAYTHTKKQYIFDYIENWINRHVDEACILRTVNSSAPMDTILSMYTQTNNSRYQKVCGEAATYIMKDAPRTPDGALEHTVTEAAGVFSQQIWADTLFMVCIFLSHMGAVSGEKELLKEAGKQLTIHLEALKDRKTGLFFHGYNCEKKNHMSGALWARANAWIIVSAFEMLGFLGDNFLGKDQVIKSVREQVQALAGLQRENGMFGTVLNQNDAYDEASATAGISYGITAGVKMGYLDKKCLEIADRAYYGVIKLVNESGAVGMVSSGTPVMPTIDAYKTIKIEPTLYGQGLTLMMLSR